MTVLSADRRAYPEGPFRTVYARLVDEVVDDRESTRGGSPVVPSQANPPKQGVSPKAGGEGSAGCRDGSLSLLRAFAGWYLESRGCIRCQGLSQTPVTCGGATMHMSRCRSAEWMPGGGQPVAGRLWTVQYRVARVNLLHVR